MRLQNEGPPRWRVAGPDGVDQAQAELTVPSFINAPASNPVAVFTKLANAYVRSSRNFDQRWHGATQTHRIAELNTCAAAATLTTSCSSGGGQRHE
jgi:hypothetical protein